MKVLERFPTPRRPLLELSADQLIAFSRVVLAIFALVAIWLDPTQPATAARTTYAILTIYLVYSIAVVLIVHATVATNASWFIHAIDISTFSLLMHLTDGPTSPFFVLFVFALFSATLHWNWRGALVTGLILTVLYMLLGLAALPGAAEPNELNTTIIRAGYLIVSACILIYLGVIRERAQRRIEQLADWPAEGASEGGFPSLGGSLSHTVEILRAKRAIVLWETPDEPFRYIAACSERDGYDVRRELPEAALPSLDAIEAPLVLSPDPTVDSVEAAGEDAARLTCYLRERVGLEGARAAVVPIRGERFCGLVVVVEPSRMTVNLLPLTQIVAARIGIEIQHFQLQQQLAEEISRRERDRVARDMHDGLLQSLAATGMQLRAIADQAPEDLQLRLRNLEHIVREQQQQLRALVTCARDRSQPATIFEVEAELLQMLDRMRAQWGCDTTLEVSPPGIVLPASYRTELALMISEAVANAVRHGGATSVAVRVTRDGEGIKLEVCDNGVHADDGWAGKRGKVPRSLGDRAAELGGSIRLGRSETGTALCVDLPVVA
jgi:signal transduction histidine kinase